MEAKSACQVCKVGVEQRLLLDWSEPLVEDVADHLEDRGGVAVCCGLPDPVGSRDSDVEEILAGGFKLALRDIKRNGELTQPLPRQVRFSGIELKVGEKLLLDAGRDRPLYDLQDRTQQSLGICASIHGFQRIQHHGLATKARREGQFESHSGAWLRATFFGCTYFDV
tara:strand:- start:158 stop:661 length:504 start_codon:yes stop_codon:yes gene_type:complete